MKKLLFPVLLLCCAIVGADHKPEADWSWHVQSSGPDETRLVVFQKELRFAIYNLECDLGEVTEGDSDDDDASIELVRLASSELLIVRCNVGAHSQQLTILDLQRKSPEPVFSATGSYSASWEIQDGELWIGYDEPCDGGASVDCPDGFVTLFVQYPETQTSQ